MYRSLASVLLIALYLLVAACSQNSDTARFERYLDRLARPLATEVPGIHEPARLRSPTVAELQLAMAPGKLDALDFLSLSGCQLQVTVGKRNSSLGKFAPPSQRLLLELEFLQFAPACIAHLRSQNETEIAQLLESTHAEKLAQLPARIFNATLGSQEFYTFWQQPTRLGDYPRNTSSAVISALEAINAHTLRWLSGDFAANNLEFELLLSEVARGDGGALTKALSSQAIWLSGANAMLQIKRAAGGLCDTGFKPSSATILENVVRKYFIGEIQPVAATLSRRHHQLMPAIEALEESLLTALPPNYRSWRAASRKALSQAANAPRRHVEQIKTLLDPCLRL
ncbi:MAG: DUF3080 family protein [Halioglobus sp.]